MSDILPPVGILEALGKESRTQLTAIGAINDLTAGDVLILEGQVQSFLYIILSGELAVTTHVAAKVVELGRLHPGDCFGEMGLLEQGLASASVTGVTDARVWSMSVDQFELFLAQNNLAAAQILLSIARVLSRRLREANELIRRNNVLPIGYSFRGPGEAITYETSKAGMAARFSIFQSGPKEYKKADISTDIKL